MIMKLKYRVKVTYTCHKIVTKIPNDLFRTPNKNDLMDAFIFRSGELSVLNQVSPLIRNCI